MLKKATANRQIISKTLAIAFIIALSCGVTATTQTSKDIEGGTGVLILVSQRTETILSPIQSFTTSKKIVCRSGQCARQRGLSASAPKPNLSLEARKFLALGD